MAGSSPCAACKLLRRRCAKDCIFAPYFSPDDPHKFATVHKVFGASNVSKMLQELPVHQRADAVSSLVYEANARRRDPVYGCVGAISYLQNQVSQLQMQLAVAQAEMLCTIQMQQESSSSSSMAMAMASNQVEVMMDMMIHEERSSASDVVHYNSSLTASIPQLVSFTSSAINVTQEEPLKRESLWT